MNNYGQDFQGNEGEDDPLYAPEDENYSALHEMDDGEDAFVEQPFPQLEHHPGVFPHTQSQFLQPPPHQAFTQNRNFTAWNGFQHPLATQSSANGLPFQNKRPSTSDTALSTPTQASYHSSMPYNRMLSESVSNTASSSDHKLKKQRIYAPSTAEKDAYVPNNTRQTSQTIWSIGQIDLPYRNIWKMRGFNRMQSEMLTELLNGDENVVVTAPTGAGKTVLFEMALVRMFKKYKDGKAVYLAPTKALCSERFRDWNNRLKEMNCKVLEMTGDSKITTPEEAKAARLIIATPEKWDFITRRAERSDPLMSKLKLFLIDEVHSIREKVRGALLEVLIARTKTRDPDTRIVAVSATIPNADDVAEWIGSRQRSARDKPEARKLTPFVFSDEFRPCPLQKEIYGFKPKSFNENYYDFEKELTKQLPNIIEEHSKGKPTLIFCSSRSGTQQVAAALYAYCQHRIDQSLHTPWPSVPENNNLGFFNEDLQGLSNYGIAFHHAGLDYNDKRMVESAFLKGQIKILCATTTLSVGVNLPAYLVIIRGTKLNTGTFEEHSDLTILQMMGRAGRPQFDKEGVCVILTEQDRREHYEQLLKGQNIIESTLHHNLREHINTEVCARGRCRAYNIEKWLKGTFLFVRMSKNWSHYSVEGCSDQLSPEENIRNITRNNLEFLSKFDLIENYDSSKPDQEFSSTEYGRTMSNYSLQFRTMIELMNLKRGATMQSLISTISQANEFTDLFIRAGEKSTYDKIIREQKLRFPPTRVENLHEKVSVLLQLALTGVNMKEITETESKTFSANSNNEQMQIMKTAPKIARAMMNIAIYRKDGLFSNEAFTLSRSLNGKSWDDDAATLTQLDGVGSGTMLLLSQHNFKSIKALAKAKPAELGMMTGKTPAQASKLINEAKKIPQISLDARESDVQQIADGSVESTIQITISLAHSPAEMKKLRLQTREGKAISIGVIIYSTNANAEECHLRRAGIWNFMENGQTLEVKCRFLTATDEIVIVCAVEDISGSSVTRKIKTSFPADRFPLKNNFVHVNSLVSTLRASESGVQDLPIASTSAVTTNGTEKGQKSKQKGDVPSPTTIQSTQTSRMKKTDVTKSKKSVNTSQSAKPVIEKEKDVTSNQNENDPPNIVQEEPSISEKDKSINIEANGFEITAVKKRKYTRKLPTVKQMKPEYDLIKAEWIKMKIEKGEPIQENEDHVAFKAMKEEDAKTRTKRHYKRKYPIPKIMEDELKQMKEDLKKYKSDQGQPSGNKVSQDMTDSETFNVAEANTENEAISQFICENASSSTAKGKGKQKEKEVADGTQITRCESAEEGKEKETNVSKNSKAAHKEGDEISALPVQSSLQASSSRLTISLASGSMIDPNNRSGSSEGEVEAITQGLEEAHSNNESDFDLENNAKSFADNDNELFTDSLLDNDLVAFCNIKEMREFQGWENEDDLY